MNMASQVSIRHMLKSWDVCDACCLRFEGFRIPKAYADTAKDPQDGEPSAKKQKSVICITCLGILQREMWTDTLAEVQREISKRKYAIKTFACALSGPTCLLVREHSVKIRLEELFPDTFKKDEVTPFKEAWKWTIGHQLSAVVGKTLDSGAVCPYMITIHMEYIYDIQELECLQKMAPDYYSQRRIQHHKYHRQDFTRKSVETVLEDVPFEEFVKVYGNTPAQVDQAAFCKRVECKHNPIYLAGRYNKYSRELSQTPWIVDGKRMMPLSVQDIIFKFVAETFNVPVEEAEKRLKFMSSGREDVDVRCLGTGRPFAIEILDPLVVELANQQLRQLEDAINLSDIVNVNKLAIVSRDDLVHLKNGEETKSKSYQALCIKLGSNSDKSPPQSPIINGEENESKPNLFSVTEQDLASIGAFSNSDKGSGNIILQQKTPLRVLHRRPSLTRQRIIIEKNTSLVDGHPNLFLVNLVTEAGTYIKEFVHGDFGRTTPNLVEIMGCKVDILALDVTNVALDWPLTKSAENGQDT